MSIPEIEYEGSPIRTNKTREKYKNLGTNFTFQHNSTSSSEPSTVSLSLECSEGSMFDLQLCIDVDTCQDLDKSRIIIIRQHNCVYSPL